MHYVKVAWKHDHPNEPVMLYSELDEARWEVRKVEVFQDGSQGYASRSGASRDTFLSPVQFPPLEQIASVPEFEPAEITNGEFEDIWRKACGLT